MRNRICGFLIALSRKRSGMGIVMKEKWKAIGWSVVYMAVAFAIMFALSMVLGMVTVLVGMKFGVLSPDNMQSMDRFMNIILKYIQQGTPLMLLSFAQEVVLFACFGLWYYFREKKYGYHPDYKRAFRPRNVLSMAGIAFFGQYAVNLLMMFLYLVLPGIFKEYEELVKNLEIDAGNPAVMVFCVVLFGPLVEEVVFRGMLFGRLRRAFSFWPSALISGILFGVYHMNLVQGIYASIFGVILAYIFEKTETIWGCYLLHAMFNMSSYVISGYETALQNAGVEVTGIVQILISICSIVVVAILLRFFGRRADRIRPNTNNKDSIA